MGCFRGGHKARLAGRNSRRRCSSSRFVIESRRRDYRCAQTWFEGLCSPNFRNFRQERCNGCHLRQLKCCQSVQRLVEVRDRDHAEPVRVLARGLRIGVGNENMRPASRAPTVFCSMPPISCTVPSSAISPVATTRSPWSMSVGPSSSMMSSAKARPAKALIWCRLARPPGRSKSADEDAVTLLGGGLAVDARPHLDAGRARVDEAVSPGFIFHTTGQQGLHVLAVGPTTTVWLQATGLWWGRGVNVHGADQDAAVGATSSAQLGSRGAPPPAIRARHQLISGDLYPCTRAPWKVPPGCRRRPG